MTGTQQLVPKSREILCAIHEAGRPLSSTEIAEAMGVERQRIGSHIAWRMFPVWLRVARTERQKNGYELRYYELTSAAKEALS